MLDILREPIGGAVERMKLFKLAWDLIGSEHASRPADGPAFSVSNYNFNNAPWDELEGVAQDLMASYDVPERDRTDGTG